jgi:hypothetical protein
MIAAILLCVSVVTCGQFGLYYWRAMILSVSALPVSDRLRVAAKIATTQVGSRDFAAIMSTHDLVPDLRGSSGSFRAIRTYFAVVEKLGRLIPSLAKWSEEEMITCSRYAAVLVDRHLERNLICAAQIRGI